MYLAGVWCVQVTTLGQPRWELNCLTGGCWRLHPGQDLAHGDDVDVIVTSQDFIQPEQESIHHLWRLDKPGSMEIQTKGSSVLFIMSTTVAVIMIISFKECLLPDEIVGQDIVERIFIPDISTTVQHGAA